MKKFVYLFTCLALFNCSKSDEPEGQEELDELIENERFGIQIGEDFFDLNQGGEFDADEYLDEEDISECDNIDSMLYQKNIFLFQNSINVDIDPNIYFNSDIGTGSGYAIEFIFRSDRAEARNGNYDGALKFYNELLDADFDNWDELSAYFESEDTEGEISDEFYCQAINTNGVATIEIYNVLNGNIIYDDNEEEWEYVTFKEGELTFERNSDNTVSILLSGGRTRTSNLPVTINFRAPLDYYGNN